MALAALFPVSPAILKSTGGIHLDPWRICSFKEWFRGPGRSHGDHQICSTPTEMLVKQKKIHLSHNCPDLGNVCGLYKLMTLATPKFLEKVKAGPFLAESRCENCILCARALQLTGQKPTAPRQEVPCQRPPRSATAITRQYHDFRSVLSAYTG